MTTSASGDGDLAGKVFLVTGASSGIGLAVARLAAERGASVVMLARRKDLLEEVAAPIGALAIAADVGDPASVRAAFGEVEHVHDHLDVIVNAAGSMRYRLLEESSDEDLLAVVGVCLLGPMYVSRAAIPLLRRSGAGDIVNLTSEVTTLYLPGSTAYSAAKAGLSRFSDVLGQELRKDGVRVSEVVVGYTATGASATIPQEDRDRFRPAVREASYSVFSESQPMDARWVAEAALYPVTRPRGQFVGVIHARATR